MTQEAVSALAAACWVAFAGIGIFAVLFLAEGRWVTGGALAVCGLIGASSLPGCIRALRRSAEPEAEAGKRPPGLPRR